VPWKQAQHADPCGACVGRRTEDVSGSLASSDSRSAALQQLGLHYTYEPSSDGQEQWHIPFGPGKENQVWLSVYSGPLVVGVLSVVGDTGTGWVPPDSNTLLQLCADLWLTKVIAQENLVTVTAQIPTGHVDSVTLALAISGVLEGVKRIRELQSARLAVNP
jgi:hypothetical protein